MSKKFLFLLLVIPFAACRSGQNPTGREATRNDISPGDNSRNALDWPGTYRGIGPCADCPGIRTELQLNRDDTYVLRMQYLERDVEMLEFRGAFTWDREGRAITLEESGRPGSRFQVMENKLARLDAEGNRIESALADAYLLHKAMVSDSITGKYWRLAEVKGNEVTLDSNADKEAFLMLNAEDQSASGSGGCNRFAGTYTLADNKISFSQIAATRMACLFPNPETDFFEALESTDYYTTDGNRLELYNNKGILLARLEFDYFK